MAPVLWERSSRISAKLIIIVPFLFFVDCTSEPLRKCTKQDFSSEIQPCNPLTNTRKVVHYLNANCQAWSHYPPQHIPCQCQPGFGEQLDAEKYLYSCKQCLPGFYSPGGELINDWRDWNKTGVPGVSMNADTYCSDFLTGKPCNSWRMGGNGEYLVSGDFKNTSDLRCFEQSILSIARYFVGDTKDNLLSFKYKVDGVSCRRGAVVCSHGLHVFVNGEQRLKVDLQFQWKEHKIPNIKKGFNRFKFVYHRSCTRNAILDVAYIKHISMVGTNTPNATCQQCPKGTFSNKKGAAECEKCIQNEYQDKEGQVSCKKCDPSKFSRIGAEKCMEYPYCLTEDYYVIPEHVENCKENASGVWIRKQKVGIPMWPGLQKNSCRENADNSGIYTKPNAPPVACKCQPGHYLQKKKNGGKTVVNCQRCKSGFYSNGAVTQCLTCKSGYAAIPGFYMEDFSEDSIPSILNQTCSGQFCKDDVWVPRGSYMATRRLPGNFETKLTLSNIQIDYHGAGISFNCSLDCRISASGTQLAKHDHCFLKIVIMKGNTTVRDTDCVSRYRNHLRNGTIQRHVYNLKEPGNYTFFALFHHEDEADYSLVSYEARIHYVHIFGAKHGIARSCTECPPGTKVSADKAFCEKCPIGTFSTNGSTSCTPCKDGFFASKEGSGECTKCGSGTKSNKARDGCDYNNCTFTVKGIKYDLSPLKVVDGPMYSVRNYGKKRHYFPLLYFINICSTSHDNSSCMVVTRKSNPKRKASPIVTKRVFLKTMACKRWSFDPHNSYSIGEVLHFLPLKENLKGGLMINLTGGYKCWHKGHRYYTQPSTSIKMFCDLNAGVGQPEPLSNNTAIDDKHCHFQLSWRTAYACPLCTEQDFTKVKSSCVNRERFVKTTRMTICRSKNGDNYDEKIEKESCTTSSTSSAGNVTNAPHSKNNPPLSRTPLIAVIVVSVLVILILIIFVVYYARRNRDLRQRIFVPGKSFSKVQEDDEDELVDNMVY